MSYQAWKKILLINFWLFLLFRMVSTLDLEKYYKNVLLTFVSNVVEFQSRSGFSCTRICSYRWLLDIQFTFLT